MGTEGPHATAHHSPLPGIVVGDFKSKRSNEREVPQWGMPISGQHASSKLNVAEVQGIFSFKRSASELGVVRENADHPSLSRAEP